MLLAVAFKTRQSIGKAVGENVFFEVRAGYLIQNAGVGFLLSWMINIYSVL